MTKAVLLPTPGDPFLFEYWLSLFDRVWQDEVDTLYILVNSPAEKEVLYYIHDLCRQNDKIRFFSLDHQIEHGQALDMLLDYVDEDAVMLVEDDGFVFRRGMVAGCFDRIRSGSFDVVGSKRGSCSFEILQRAQQIWGLRYTGMGDQGCNFWPNFFFCWKNILRETTRHFGAKAWKQGEVIKWLGNYIVTEPIANGDTFVETSLEIRSKIPQCRIHCVPQYHGSPHDLDHFKEKTNLFDGKAPWCHIGSLSSGFGGILTDDQGRSLARRKIDPPKPNDELPKWCNLEGEKLEFERRVQWWSTFHERAKPTKAMQEIHELYGHAINRIIKQYKLNKKRIEQRKRAYATLGL